MSMSSQQYYRQNCGCPISSPSVSIANSPICSGLALFMLIIESFINYQCDISTPCDQVASSWVETEPYYDFIVVGAGAAGSVVAGRLSENKNYNVLLLEAGPPEPLGARVPSFYRTFWGNEEVDWKYRTVPDSNFCLDQGDRGCKYPRGKVVGGSNLLNGMMYHRGHAADYEDWVNAGAIGWSWEENRRYFYMTEGNKQIGSVVSGDYHSADGPLPVQQFKYQPPFMYELMRAINESDLPLIADMNDPTTPEGFAIAQAMNDDGQRVTSARAFLKPRPNLTVKTHSHVTRVILEGNRATGVEYIDVEGNTQTVYASKEVVLSAGALNSPHILLLSGIGPQETLDEFDIPVVADLPVGKNLRNHVGLTLFFILTNDTNTQTLDWQVFQEYLLTRGGPMSSTAITQLSGTLYSSLGDRSRNQPDLQFFFNGFYSECSRTGNVDERLTNNLQGRNISVNGVVLLPRSVGYLTLQSTDPLVPPLFYPNYFSEPEDMVMTLDAGRYIQRILESDTMKNRFGAIPDPAYTEVCDWSETWSDDWLECMARQHTDAQNHQIGTASIGQVVDPELKVYGIDGLRVIDASVIPTLPTGNPQAAIMMVGERGAELIKQTWAYHRRRHHHRHPQFHHQLHHHLQS